MKTSASKASEHTRTIRTTTKPPGSSATVRKLRGAEGGAAYAVKAYSGGLKELVQEDDPLQRVNIVRTGVRLRDAMQVQQRLHMPKNRFYSILGFPEATMKRKEKDDARLSPEQTERVLGIARLISEVDRIVAESGSADGFNSGVWVTEWLDQPVPALGGQRPAELMDTLSGQTLVLDLIARMQSGAYA